MDQVLEQISAPENVAAIEATLNYLVNNGEKIFTAAGGAGALDVRGGTIDPRRVVIHNGRPQAKDFVLEREGFRFVRHDTKVADFFDEDAARLLSGDGSAGEDRDRRRACCRVRSHAADRGR
jgi:hypothetical protein